MAGQFSIPRRPGKRAKAVAERFAGDLPSRSVPELERIVTSAIKRGLSSSWQSLRTGRSGQPHTPWGRGENPDNVCEVSIQRRPLEGHQTAYDLGASAYFAKPLPFDELTDILESTFKFWGKCVKPPLPQNCR